MNSELAKIPSINDLIVLVNKDLPTIDSPFLKVLIDEIVAGIKSKPENYQLEDKSRQEISDVIIKKVKSEILKLTSSSFKRIINGTGVILHTGLGRAPLGNQAMEYLGEILGYTNLEVNIDSGKRGERLDHITPLLRLLTGTEDAVIVNNNAAAVLLILNSLAKRKEVIISRGELVEIGGSFRMAEVMKSSGAKMIEIGSTNKTHLNDYKSAVTERTAAIMLVHPSNYKIIGFTQKPEHSDIIRLAHLNNIPVIYDLGSGALIDLQKFGFEQEPVVKNVLATGYDIVCFSGDKLLGGPQAGIILGNKRHLQKIKRNHLLRALRCDKINLAILSHTLQQYLNNATLLENNLTLKLLSRNENQLKKISGQIMNNLDKKHKEKIYVINSTGRAGSGAYPVSPIPSLALQIISPHYKANQLSKKLRLQEIPIFGYIMDDIFHLDLLALLDEDLPVISHSLNKIL